MTNSQYVERPLYSSGTFPQRTGFFGLSLRASMFGGVGMVTALIVLMTAGVLAGLLVAGIGAAFLAPMVLTIGRRSYYEVIQIRLQWWRRRVNGSTVYRSGPHSRIPGGRYKLPGLLAATTLHEGVDRLGNPFGLIHRRRSDEYTVVLECFPGGDEALTQGERDMMTADWGSYLASLGLPGDITAAVAVIDTIPATGLRLAREVQRMTANSSSDLATAVMIQSAQTFPAGKMQQLARLSITFRATTKARRTDPGEMASELARRLPALYEDLLGVGVEAAPMSPGQIVAMVHRSYNPSAEADFEELEVLGEEHGLEWDDAGPATAKARWGFYRHDGVKSITWEMACPPESVFPDTVLKPLLAPHEALPRKRLAIVYRPFTAGDSTRQVDREFKDAVASSQQGKGIKSAASNLRLQATAQQREEQVRGAGLLRYSMLLTVTVVEDVATSAAVNESLSARSRLKLRRAYGYQDAAFAAGLGIGLLLPDHSTMSQIASNA
ncbi:SCO6880 family protein [Nocardia asteroides]|uniref:SCO6880 family protein n=1 Tax=Nocardia asteroides TaxID=1824 RepID=UPI0037C64712